VPIRHRPALPSCLCHTDCTTDYNQHDSRWRQRDASLRAMPEVRGIELLSPTGALQESEWVDAGILWFVTVSPAFCMKTNRFHSIVPRSAWTRLAYFTDVSACVSERAAAMDTHHILDLLRSALSACEYTSLFTVTAYRAFRHLGLYVSLCYQRSYDTIENNNIGTGRDRVQTQTANICVHFSAKRRRTNE